MSKAGFIFVLLPVWALPVSGPGGKPVLQMRFAFQAEFFNFCGTLRALVPVAFGAFVAAAVDIWGVEHFKFETTELRICLITRA